MTRETAIVGYGGKGDEADLHSHLALRTFSLWGSHLSENSAAPHSSSGKAKLGPMTPEEFLAGLEPPRRQEVEALHALFLECVPDWEPVVMESGMLGYGPYRTKYASGREVEWVRGGISPRKAAISVHIMAWDKGGYLAEQAKGDFPKAAVGKSCIRFKKLSDISLDAMRSLLTRAAHAKLGGEEA